VQSAASRRPYQVRLAICRAYRKPLMASLGSCTEAAAIWWLLLPCWALVHNRPRVISSSEKCALLCPRSACGCCVPQSHESCHQPSVNDLKQPICRAATSPHFAVACWLSSWARHPKPCLGLSSASSTHEDAKENVRTPSARRHVGCYRKTSPVRCFLSQSRWERSIDIPIDFQVFPWHCCRICIVGSPEIEAPKRAFASISRTMAIF